MQMCLFAAFLMLLTEKTHESDAQLQPPEAKLGFQFGILDQFDWNN